MYIVKNSYGQAQRYDANKLYNSIYRASLSAQAPQGEAKATAERILREIQPLISSKQEVTSADIRQAAMDRLRVYNPHASYLYGTQMHPTQTSPRFKPKDRFGSLQAPAPSIGGPPPAMRPSWMDIGKKGNWGP